MSVPRSDELLFAAGGDVWEKYGTFVKRTLPEEERGTFSRSSVGSFRDRSLTLREAESGVLRPTWISGESEYATRLEASRTNEMTRSEALDHADWSKTRVSVTADQAMGPDGATSLDELVEDGTTGSHDVRQTKTVTADTSYALSCWAIANTRDWLALRMHEDGNSSNNVVAWFDLSSGLVGTNSTGGTGGFSRAYIRDWTDVSAGLYRCVLVGSVGNSATSIQGHVHLADADGSFSYAGDGSSSLYAGYTQLEDSVDSASSYVSTTDSATTRNGDEYSTGLPFAPRTLTSYLKLVRRIPAGGSTVLFTLGDSTSPPHIQVRTPSGSGELEAVAKDGDGNQVNAQTSGLGSGLSDVVEVRFDWDPDSGDIDIGAAKNGGSIQTGAGSGTWNAVSSFGADVIAFNERGDLSGTNRSFADYISARVSTGVRTMQEMRDIEL